MQPRDVQFEESEAIDDALEEWTALCDFSWELMKGGIEAEVPTPEEVERELDEEWDRIVRNHLGANQLVLKRLRACPHSGNNSWK